MSSDIPDYMGTDENVSLLLEWLSSGGTMAADDSEGAEMRRWASSRAAIVIPKLMDDLKAAANAQ